MKIQHSLIFIVSELTKHFLQSNLNIVCSKNSPLWWHSLIITRVLLEYITKYHPPMIAWIICYSCNSRRLYLNKLICLSHPEPPSGSMYSISCSCLSIPYRLHVEYSKHARLNLPTARHQCILLTFAAVRSKSHSSNSSFYKYKMHFCQWIV